jgi:hypothetical protein
MDSEYEEQVPPVDPSWDPALIRLNEAARDHREAVGAAKEKGAAVSALVVAAAREELAPSMIAAASGLEEDLVHEIVRNATHAPGAQRNGH